MVLSVEIKSNILSTQLMCVLGFKGTGEGAQGDVCTVSAEKGGSVGPTDSKVEGTLGVI